MNLNKNTKIAISLGIIMALLFACVPSNQRSGFNAKTGTLRDTIFSLERLGTKAGKMWVTHDDVAFYCILPEDRLMSEFIENAILNHNGEAVITYKSLTWQGSLSDTGNNPCGYSGDYATGSDFNVATNAYVVTKVELVPMRGSLATPFTNTITSTAATSFSTW